MTRVGNSEQVMALVRQQLQRLARREKTARSSRTERSLPAGLSERQRLRALGAVESLTDEEFCRDFVRALLTEEFGEAVGNSAGFQRVIERTSAAIQNDAEVVGLLKEVRGSL